MKHVAGKLNSDIWTLSFNPWHFLICQKLMRACRIDKNTKKCLWGKTGNLFPQLALISPCWVYFILTHKQSLAHRRWRGKTQMKDACRTTGCCWDLCSLSDKRASPRVSVWEIYVVLLELIAVVWKLLYNLVWHCNLC